jgi:flagellin
MTRINTNVASLRGLRSLNRATQLLDTSLTRLSTGLQINTGRDNPAGLIASESLRLQITSIEQSIKNSNRANNVIATADAALNEIGGLLNQIRGLVQEGLNTGALSQAEIEANQLQIDSALSAVNRIASNTKFGSDKLIDGTKAFVTSVTAADAAKLAEFQINEALFGSATTIDIDASITTAAEKGELLYAGGGLGGETTLEVSGSKGSQVLFFGSASTVDHIFNAVNAVTDATGVEAEITTAAVAGTISTAAGPGIVDFTDARATSGQGVFDAAVTISIVDGTGDGVTQGNEVVTVTTDANGDHTIEIAIEATVSTAADIAAAVTASAPASALVTAVDSTAGVVGVQDITLADGTDGEMTFRSQQFGSDEFVDINVLEGTFATTLNDATTAATRDEGADIGAVINGQTAVGRGLRAAIKTATLDASLTFLSANNTVGETATVTLTGGGSLFQIGQDVSVAGQVGLGIDAINTARLGGVTGKLYELGTGAGKSLLDIGPSVSGSDVVQIIEDALDKVSTLRGRLGSLQKNVIETNISTLGIALENISEARSQIIDTDFASETAALTRAQILSQSGISVLAIANQNPAQVLSLLG